MQYLSVKRPKITSHVPGMRCSNLFLATPCVHWTLDAEVFETRERLDKVLNDSIERGLSDLPDRYFDLVIFNDVLHLPAVCLRREARYG